MSPRHVTLIFFLVISFTILQTSCSEKSKSYLASFVKWASGRVRSLTNQHQPNRVPHETPANEGGPLKPEKPRGILDLLVHPLKPILVVKKFKPHKMMIPRQEDNFYWDSKKHWYIPLTICGSTMLMVLTTSCIVLWRELRPVTLPRNPEDQTTAMSRYFSKSNIILE